MSAVEKRASRTRELIVFGALAAIVGGLLRIASTFIPYAADAAWLEALYGVIDLCLLFGVVGIYLAVTEELGLAGLALFLVTLAGVASIVGPDAPAFGIDFYRVGALVFVAGLAGLSVQMLRAGVMRASAALWIATLVFSLSSAIAPVAFMAAGLAIGAGFVAAGVDLLRLQPTRMAAA